jgi:hypothetical protein
METQTENIPVPRNRTQFSLRSVIICFNSIGVVLGLFKVSQLQVTDALIVFSATICLLLLAVQFILRQMKAFPLERFRREWSIVSFVSLGGAFYGFCFGGIVGVEAAMGGKLVDTIFFVFLYGFTFGAFGMILFGLGAIGCVALLSIILWVYGLLARLTVILGTKSEDRHRINYGSVHLSEFTNTASGVVGMIVGAAVGATLLSFVFGEIPTHQDDVVIRVLLPALVGASFGSLASRGGKVPGESSGPWHC